MKFKKIITFTIAGTMLMSSGVALAEYNPNDKGVNVPITTTKINITDTKKPLDSKGEFNFILVINGEGLNPKETNVYIKENGSIMIPLRDLSEALGYEVKWNGEKRLVELNKGNQYIMVKIDEDYYSFGKMAPIKLGNAAEINANRTYVPLKYAEDILKAEVTTDETGVINVKTKESSDKKELNSNIVGEITSIKKTDKNTLILIEENIAGSEDKKQIVLYVDEETKIIDPVTNEEISLDDLNEGDKVRGFYGPKVTQSIPAKSKAEKIEVLKGVDIKTGTISKIIKDENSRIFIGDRMNGMILNINENTKIVTKDNKELRLENLKEGMNVEVFHDLAVTRSLPPISNARKIVVIL